MPIKLGLTNDRTSGLLKVCYQAIMKNGTGESNDDARFAGCQNFATRIFRLWPRRFLAFLEGV